MPEAYTHLRCAQAGAALAQIHPEDPIAYGAGANGPDMLFCYRCWLPGAKRGQDLPALGERMHREKTGAFLLSLLNHAHTKAQRSYALGFLSHYATDTAVHPYVGWMSGPEGLYPGKGGHGYFEAALDSTLHRLDTGDGAVPARDCCPRLLGAALAEVGAQLQAAILETYGIEVTREALADTFHHTWYLRRTFVSRLRIKRALLWLVEPLFGGRGRVTGHMTPAALRGGHSVEAMPAEWKHPVTGEPMRHGLPWLLDHAQRCTAAYLLAAQSYWRGKVRRAELEQLLGSRSYETGLEDALSLGLAQPEEAPAEETALPAAVKAPAAETTLKKQAAPAAQAVEAGPAA